MPRSPRRRSPSAGRYAVPSSAAAPMGRRRPRPRDGGRVTFAARRRGKAHDHVPSAPGATRSPLVGPSRNRRRGMCADRAHRRELRGAAGRRRAGSGAVRRAAAGGARLHRLPDARGVGAVAANLGCADARVDGRGCDARRPGDRGAAAGARPAPRDAASTGSLSRPPRGEASPGSGDAASTPRAYRRIAAATAVRRTPSAARRRST